MTMNFSIVIPNWNGQKLLKKNLPIVGGVLGDVKEIIVVDNGSTDGSVKLIENLKFKIKNLRPIYNQENLGFARAVNQGIKKARGEIVVLLNNDVLPEKDFLWPLSEDFANKTVFAVSLNEPQWSWVKGKWVNGFLEHEPGRKTKKPHISFWASGGSGAFRKDIWEKMGGFDEIYAPFYWEDVDLSYRAWKRGYKVLWDPRSIVYHKHEGTIGRQFSSDYVNFISQRNQLLFIWKNINSPKMTLGHKFWLLKRLLTAIGYWKPYLAALVKIPKILPRRLAEWREKRVSDEEIFSYFS